MYRLLGGGGRHGSGEEGGEKEDGVTGKGLAAGVYPGTGVEGAETSMSSTLSSSGT